MIVDADKVKELIERLRKMPNFWLNGSSWMMATQPAPLGIEAADFLESQAAEIERLKEDLLEEKEENFALAAECSLESELASAAEAELDAAKRALAEEQANAHRFRRMCNEDFTAEYCEFTDERLNTVNPRELADLIDARAALAAKSTEQGG